VVDEAALAKALKEKWIRELRWMVCAGTLAAGFPVRDPAIEDRCRLYPHFGSAGKITRLSSAP